MGVAILQFSSDRQRRAIGLAIAASWVLAVIAAAYLTQKFAVLALVGAVPLLLFPFRQRRSP